MSCAKCGSGPIMDGVRIIARGHDNQTQDLAAAEYKNPGAMIFKGEVTTPIVGRICGSCGYAELYATNPSALLEVARAR